MHPARAAGAGSARSAMMSARRRIPPPPFRHASAPAVGCRCMSLRASDEERERTAQALRRHYEAGRIDSDEFEERLDAAYAAKTQDELAALLADLPRQVAAPAPPRAVERSR